MSEERLFFVKAQDYGEPYQSICSLRLKDSGKAEGRGASGSQLTVHILQIYGQAFKRRAPRAISEIRRFAEKAMVRIRAPFAPHSAADPANTMSSRQCGLYNNLV